MSRVSAGNELFFSLIMDDFTRKSEDDLWKRASAIKQGENKGYVETSRDAFSALLQAGDEGGFILVGEGSFAQYVESERFGPALAKMADTDYFRVTHVCLMTNSGFRKVRSDGAAKYMEWFEGETARKAIAGFSIGGMNPFVPAGTPGE
jgi:ABC-type tungstate transport system permease subunit